MQPGGGGGATGADGDGDHPHHPPADGVPVTGRATEGDRAPVPLCRCLQRVGGGGFRDGRTESGRRHRRATTITHLHEPLEGVFELMPDRLHVAAPEEDHGDRRPDPDPLIARSLRYCDALVGQLNRAITLPAMMGEDGRTVEQLGLQPPRLERPAPFEATGEPVLELPPLRRASGAHT